MEFIAAVGQGFSACRSAGDCRSGWICGFGSHQRLSPDPFTVCRLNLQAILAGLGAIEQREGERYGNESWLGRLRKAELRYGLVILQARISGGLSILHGDDRSMVGPACAGHGRSSGLADGYCGVIQGALLLVVLAAIIADRLKGCRRLASTAQRYKFASMTLPPRHRHKQEQGDDLL
ncbi:hypothetical protein O5478_17715 [Escherichia coli]|nr:hypothetical protein [Escherichia coli]